MRLSETVFNETMLNSSQGSAALADSYIIHRADVLQCGGRASRPSQGDRRNWTSRLQTSS